MIFSPLLAMQVRPKLSSWFNQCRNLRPSIKIGKDKFQLQIDVRHYGKDEIRVKARPEYVIIEGYHRAQTKRGLVMRKFMRKFKLPSGCDMQSMESKLSQDGMLTITVPRHISKMSSFCETLIPTKLDCRKVDKRVPVNGNVVTPAEAKDPSANKQANQTTPSDKNI